MFRLHWGPSWYQTKLCTWHLWLLSSIQVKVLWYSDAWYSSTGHLNLTSKSLFREESGNRLTSIWIPSYDLFVGFEEPNKTWPLSESTQAFESRNTIPSLCILTSVYSAGAWNLWMVKKRLGCKWSEFSNGIWNLEARPLEILTYGRHFVWNPNKNFWILNGWD